MKNTIISSKLSIRSLFIGASIMVATIVVLSLPSVSQAQTLTRQLQQGMSGSDVTTLQTFLAQDRTIYPQGLVTGYFGPLTKSAVSNFQSRNGISTVGRVGPITLVAINGQMSQGMFTTGSRAPTIGTVAINTGANSATLSWNTDENAKGVVYFNSSPLLLTEHLNSVDVVGNVAMNDGLYRTSQSVMVQNLQPNTTYHYMAYVTDQQGNVSVTWPSTFRTSN